ncbi:MAG: hypothetical protein GEV10_00755 [Streptosporangiales bacterium]|nr:hypothetical protein [Streptosporangiales bacterium]
MPVRHSPDPRRVVVLVIASMVVLVALAVITSVSSGFSMLGQRYAVVHFDGTVSYAERERVQLACAAPPLVKPVPMGDDKAKSARLSNVSYRVDKADEGDIATLSKCLKKFDGVVGIELNDLTTG